MGIFHFFQSRGGGEFIEPQAGNNLKTPVHRSALTTFHFLLAAGLPLLAALVVAKAFAAGTWQWRSIRFPLKLVIAAFSDLVFILGWTLLAALALSVAARLPRVTRGLRGAILVGSALIVLYGAANVWIYGALHEPLTYSPLVMAGSFEDVRSSIISSSDRWTLPALVGGPIAYLAIANLLLRAKWPGRKGAQAVVALLIAIYCPIGVLGYSRAFVGHPDEALAHSPHWALLCSMVNRWRGEDSLTLPNGAPVSYRDDFKTVAQRAASPKAAVRSSRIKNVVLVVLESTGVQFMDLYGGPYPTTPKLSSESGNALVFGNVYSNAGNTVHALLPLILSQYPGIGFETYASTYPYLAGTSAAQVLHDRGYRTAFLTGALLDYKATRPFLDHRGFDLVYGFEDFQKIGVGRRRVSSWAMDDPPLFDYLFKWISQDPSKPFFVTAWTQQTHHPYTLPPYQQPRNFLPDQSTDASRLLNLYLNDLHSVDEQLGRLFAFLRQNHLDDNTLVVITGDHGEAFGFPHHWMFHGTALYQESVNVPCIFWNPGLFAQQPRSETIGGHVDLLPTIFDLMAVPPPPAWQGTSLLDPARAQRAYFTCYGGSLLLGMRDGPYKFIYNATLAREELYDLATDLTEQNNLAKLRPDLCRQYRLRLSSWDTFERSHLKSLAAANSRDRK